MTLPVIPLHKLLVIFFFLNLLGAQLLHEVGHWAVLQLYGRQPLWGVTSLVQLWDHHPQSPEQWVAFTNPDGDQGWLHLTSAPETNLEMVLFLIAGPGIQVLAVSLGIFFFYLGKSPYLRIWGYLLTFVNAFGQFFYQGVSLLRRSGGDETLLAYYWDVSPVLIYGVLIIFFFVALVFVLRYLENWRSRGIWIAAMVIGTLPIGPVLMLVNGIIIEQVDAGNRFFQGIVGFSLPVVLIGVISFLGLWYLGRFENAVVEDDFASI
jgi:hypothetical protein